ncbi:oligosaccharide flippase family protein [Elusimicrobiota bacterium]
MSQIKKFYKQSGHYFIGIFFIQAAGFISFPIFTRVFSVADYGILNLISSTLLFLVAFSKLGLQTSSIRFYEEFKLNNDLIRFYSTLFFGTVFISGAVTFLFWLTVKIIPVSGPNDQILKLLSYTAILVFVRAVTSILKNFLRAEQKTKLYNKVNVIQKYVSLGLSIFFVFYLIKGLYGFYAGVIMTEMVVMVYLAYVYRKYFKLNNISADLMKKSVIYGGPLVVSEFLAIILAFGDRFLIQLYMGPDAVGLYSAGYNLPDYIARIFIMPLSLAIQPAYMSIWANSNPEETKKFLSKTLNYCLLVLIPIIMGSIAVSRDIITFLASSKYYSSYVIIPYVITGLIAYKLAYNLLGAGLFIHKKTLLLSKLTIIAGASNVVMNILLIPKFGIMGAAIATFFAYLFLAVFTVIYSFKYLRFKIDLSMAAIYTLFSFIMFAIIRTISLDSKFLNLSAKIAAGIAIYSILVLIFDGKTRKSIMNLYKTKLKGGN